MNLFVSKLMLLVSAEIWLSNITHSFLDYMYFTYFAKCSPNAVASAYTDIVTVRNKMIK